MAKILLLLLFYVEKLYSKTIVDYWGIEYDVTSTWGYQYSKEQDKQNFWA